MKQDILEYVDIKFKIERKKARKEKLNLSRDDTRYLIWVDFVEICNNRFGIGYSKAIIGYMIDNDKYIEITKI